MSFQASSAKIHYEPGSWQEMLNDIYTGTVVGAAHSIYLVAKWWYVNLIRPILNVFGLYLPEDKVVESEDGEKTLKVVAVGYGRTGTVSPPWWSLQIFVLERGPADVPDYSFSESDFR